MTDPQRVTLENLNVGSHDVGQGMNNACDILQTGTAASSEVTYDDVSVFGQALHIRLRDVPPEPTTTDALAAFTGSAHRATVMDVLRKRLVEAGIEVQSVRSVYPSLEDIFVSFTRKMDQSALLL